MKKLTVVFLIITLCIMFACAAADDVSLAGTWYISHAEETGYNIQVIDPSAVTLTLNEDGSFVYDHPFTPCTGTWSFEDSKLVLTTDQQNGSDSNTISCLYQNDEIILYTGQPTLYMSQTPAEPSALILSPAIAADSIDAFNGYWQPVALNMYGLYMEMDEETAKSAYIYLIENGKVKQCHSSDSGEPVSFEEYDGVFGNGILTVDSCFGPDNPAFFTISIRENGSLFLTVHNGRGNEKAEYSGIYIPAE